MSRPIITSHALLSVPSGPLIPAASARWSGMVLDATATCICEAKPGVDMTKQLLCVL